MLNCTEQMKHPDRAYKPRDNHTASNGNWHVVIIITVFDGFVADGKALTSIFGSVHLRHVKQ
jgi:hypothetical protein